MLPGDIDLTQNLDFRKTRKREIPKLPALWKKTPKAKINNNSITTIYGTLSNYTLDVSDDNIISYNGTSNSSFNYTISTTNSGWSEWTTLNNDGTITTRSNTLNITYSNVGNYKITINGDYSIKNDEYDVFGNKKIYEKPIPKIPWKVVSENSETIQDIPWRLRSHFTLRRREYKPSIPWDMYTSGYQSPYSDRINKIKDSICYLKNQTRSFINSYLEGDEEVDMSYLTNMNWLRVRDAIID